MESAVWKYFELVSKDVAKCKLCNKNYSRKGRGTTSLKNHLKSIHSSQYKEVIDADLSAKKKEAASRNSPTPLQKMKQVTIESCLEKKLLWDANDPRTKELDTVIAEMIATDDQPFDFVEGIGFMRLLQKSSPHYKLKKRQFYADLLRDKIYPKVFNKIALEIKSMIQTGLSFTTDVWSDTSAGVSLLSLTSHGINNDFQRKNLVLCAQKLDGRHTGEYLSNVFHSMLKTWEIPINNVHCVLRDCGANMKKALFLSGVNNLDCVLHKLQLVIKSGLEAQSSIQEIISKCRSIATHFHHSTMAQEELKCIQKRLDVPQRTVLQDVQTRWNSTLYMMERILLLKEPLALYVGSHSHLKILTNVENDVASNCIKFLKPFEEITKTISSSTSSLSDVIPLITTLRKQLESFSKEDEYGIKRMRDIMKSELANRFSCLENNDLYTISTYLDPRYKGKFFPLDILQQVQARLSKKIEELQSHEFTDGQPAKKIKISQEALCSTGKSITESLSEFLESSSDDETYSMPKEITQIIDAYHQEKRLAACENPISWWKNRQNVYPYLSKLARQYLACPPSSVPSERLFSSAGLIYDEKRSRLSAETAERLMFLKHNLPIIKFEY